ncbi:MAG: hypothetical protein ACFBRM_12125 [Pikeienuella sp.]
MIAVPVFGSQSHISIDRRFPAPRAPLRDVIRESAVTPACAADGRQLKHLVGQDKTGSEVWADSACRSRAKKTWLAQRMLTR